MKKINIIALFLLILGGLNWGFWGVVDFNIVDYVFGKIWIDKVLYFLIGVSAIYVAVNWKGFSSKIKKKQ